MEEALKSRNCRLLFFTFQNLQQPAPSNYTTIVVRSDTLNAMAEIEVSISLRKDVLIAPVRPQLEWSVAIHWNELGMNRSSPGSFSVQPVHS